MCLSVCSGGQGPPDGTDAEDTERCPICLGVLSGGELAMPDSCCHVFCLSCLLTWAEVKLRADCSMPPSVIENKTILVGMHDIYRPIWGGGNYVIFIHTHIYPIKRSDKLTKRELIKQETFAG